MFMLQFPPTAYFTLTTDATERIHIVSLDKALPRTGGVTFHDNTEHWCPLKSVDLGALVTKADPLIVTCTKKGGSDVLTEFQSKVGSLDYQIRTKASLDQSEWKAPSGAPSHDPSKTAVFKTEVPASFDEKPSTLVTFFLVLTIASNEVTEICWYAPKDTNPRLFGDPSPGDTHQLNKSALGDIPSGTGGHWFYDVTLPPA